MFSMLTDTLSILLLIGHFFASMFLMLKYLVDNILVCVCGNYSNQMSYLCFYFERFSGYGKFRANISQRTHNSYTLPDRRVFFLQYFYTIYDYFSENIFYFAIQFFIMLFFYQQMAVFLFHSRDSLYFQYKFSRSFFLLSILSVK